MELFFHLLFYIQLRGNLLNFIVLLEFKVLTDIFAFYAF